MEQERVNNALARIEAAAARIEAISSRAPSGGNSGLVHRHEKLRADVEASLSELDALIGSLET